MPQYGVFLIVEIGQLIKEIIEEIISIDVYDYVPFIYRVRVKNLYRVIKKVTYKC